MTRSSRNLGRGAGALSVVLASLGATGKAEAAAACPRPVAGSVVAPPADLFSRDGVLSVTLDYLSTTDADNRTLYCFVTPNGVQSPTLHVKPGDTLKILLRNRLPKPSAATAPMMMSMASNVCGAATMDASSVNMHFHGTNTSPACHADDALDTLVNSGEDFAYSVSFPADEPAGLYWYHPHVHGLSDAAVQGGASGAIVVDGIQNAQPAVAGLPVRMLVIRDQNIGKHHVPPAATAEALPVPPSWDLTLNYVPIAFPQPIPAIITLPPARREFWRVLNASADTIADLQLIYDGVAQPLDIVALDGVATGSQDGIGRGTLVKATHLLLPPAGRGEFIITTPSAKIARATLETRRIDTGPAGDSDTARTLATLKTTNAAADQSPTLPAGAAVPGPQRFRGLMAAAVTARRTLYFSEKALTVNADGPTNFFITVDGQKPTLFSSTNPPAIVTRSGAVEDWTIENRTQEVHEFHIHQIHFMMLAQDGKTLPPDQRQFRDTVQVPYWSGKGTYPSITVRMDFRGGITGDFVYHCHILDHEDNGMMAIIRVLPKRQPVIAPH